jgi:hypothetical protein
VGYLDIDDKISEHTLHDFCNMGIDSWDKEDIRPLYAAPSGNTRSGVPPPDIASPSTRGRHINRHSLVALRRTTTFDRLSKSVYSCNVLFCLYVSSWTKVIYHRMRTTL